MMNKREGDYQKELSSFCVYLMKEEKSKATIEKYQRDVSKFLDYLAGQGLLFLELQKEYVINYKEMLIQEYKPASVNSMLAALNCFLEYLGHNNCKVKPLRIQRQYFIEESRSMSRKEYQRLLHTANRLGKKRLEMILETLSKTGIRVSELEYFTLAQIHTGYIKVMNKGKCRTIFIPRELRVKLLRYAKEQKISSGRFFVTRSGQSINRSNLWREIRNLCQLAGVESSKGFPHNFRHLFARVFYEVKKDMVKLAELLGHSSLETTRIYTMPSFGEYMYQLEHMEFFG